MNTEKRMTLEAMEALAKPATRAALEGCELSDELRRKVVLGYGYEQEGNWGVFELYVPGPRPQDARVLVRTYVHAITGEVKVEKLEDLGRVAPGDCSPGAPTDPDVQNYRIRFLR